MFFSGGFSNFMILRVYFSFLIVTRLNHCVFVEDNVTFPSYLCFFGKRINSVGEKPTSFSYEAKLSHEEECNKLGICKRISQKSDYGQFENKSYLFNE